MPGKQDELNPYLVLALFLLGLAVRVYKQGVPASILRALSLGLKAALIILPATVVVYILGRLRQRWRLVFLKLSLVSPGLWDELSMLSALHSEGKPLAYVLKVGRHGPAAYYATTGNIEYMGSVLKAAYPSVEVQPENPLYAIPETIIYGYALKGIPVIPGGLSRLSRSIEGTRTIYIVFARPANPLERLLASARRIMMKGEASEYLEAPESRYEGRVKGVAREYSAYAQGRRTGYWKASIYALTVDEPERLRVALKTAYPNTKVKRLRSKQTAKLLQRLSKGNLYLKHGFILSTVQLSQFIGVPPATGPSETVVERQPLFRYPSRRELRLKGPAIGWIVSGGRPVAKAILPLRDAAKGIVIVGVKGSGKTNTAKVIVRKMTGRGYPVLVLDRHGEYADLGLPVYDPSFAGLNPLKLLGKGRSGILMALQVFRQALQLDRDMEAALLQALKTKPGGIADLKGSLESPHIPAGLSKARIRLLSVLDRLPEESGGDFRVVLGHSCVLDLSRLPTEEAKNYYSLVVLALTWLERMARPASRLHGLLVEEAHNVVPELYRKRSTSEFTVADKIITELRKYREYTVLVDQSPMKISRIALRNAGVTICHRISYLRDAELLRETLPLTGMQTEKLKTLKTGEAIIRTLSIQNPYPAKITKHVSLQ